MAAVLVQELRVLGVAVSCACAGRDLTVQLHNTRRLTRGSERSATKDASRWIVVLLSCEEDGPQGWTQGWLELCAASLGLSSPAASLPSHRSGPLLAFVTRRERGTAALHFNMTLPASRNSTVSSPTEEEGSMEIMRTGRRQES